MTSFNLSSIAQALAKAREPMLLEGLNTILMGYEDTVARLRSIQEQEEARRTSSRAGDIIADAAGGMAGAGTVTAVEEREPPNLDLADPNRRIWIFTTACMPWMTGTSVNPLLRAAFLARGRPKGKVTLVVPWLDVEDQAKVYPNGKRFETEQQQDEYVHQWLDEAGLGEEGAKISLMFYKGRYHPSYGSIFPMGDLTALVPDEEADVCIMEEPEHLNWFRAAGVLWTDKFNFVVGIIHTNYLFYAGQEVGGTIKKEVVRLMSAWMVRAHCHRVIKLSAALQTYAPEKEAVCNVHGVREQFLAVGARIAEHAGEPSPFTEGVYFIGKTLWSKGYDKLLPLLRSYRRHTGENLDMDAYGDGPQKDSIMRRCKRFELGVTFKDAIDHVKLEHHKVFVNPSKSEVLCTTVAEALAMGKFVVCARHESNEFFYQFPNCLPFRSKRESYEFFYQFAKCLPFRLKREFVSCMKWAREHEPEPLTPDLHHILTWSAATDRLVEVSSAPSKDLPDAESPAQGGSAGASSWSFSFSPERPKKQAQSLDKFDNFLANVHSLDNFLANLHMQMSRGKHGDVFRKICGAGPAARQSDEGEDAEEDGDFVVVAEGAGRKHRGSKGGSISLSKSELSLVELLSTGIQKGVVDNVLNPLVTAYRHFVEQGFTGFMRSGKEAMTDPFGTAADEEDEDEVDAPLRDSSVPPPGCATDDDSGDEGPSVSIGMEEAGAEEPKSPLSAIVQPAFVQYMGDDSSDEGTSVSIGMEEASGAEEPQSPLSGIVRPAFEAAEDADTSDGFDAQHVIVGADLHDIDPELHAADAVSPGETATEGGAETEVPAAPEASAESKQEAH
ncbi:hypothetical protein JKP88DRAFT_353820 [Tribonema minus]|uniref:digalactosyldiacylglycerol synthase n=1 Tax=Tribonema minus TaxID=303371 RepID=A0A835Z8T0_9STRA|nr:hypothetical protein JKP88DRAFT_353820 [Tribonema minus]